MLQVTIKNLNRLQNKSRHSCHERKRLNVKFSKFLSIIKILLRDFGHYISFAKIELFIIIQKQILV